MELLYADNSDLTSDTRAGDAALAGGPEVCQQGGTRESPSRDRTPIASPSKTGNM